MFRPTPFLMPICLAVQAVTPVPSTLQALIESEAFSMPAGQLLQLGQSLPADPAFDVIQLIEDNQFRCDSAGRMSAVYRYVFRVDRESALSGWGGVQVSWSPWLNERPVIRARVITPDGREHALDPSTLGDAQEPDEAREMFGDRRLVRGPLPMLRVGAIAEVEIRVREHRPFAASGFRHTLSLGWNVPVHRSRVQLEVPATLPLKHRLFGLPDTVLTREKVKDLQRLRVDQGLSLPQRAREPFQAFDEEDRPSLLVTTAGSWAQVVAEYRTILEPKLADPGLRAWVQEAVGEAKTREQKIQRILTRLQTQIRYVGLEFGESAIVPRPPQETLRRGYGDCKDQSTLLVALLREAGIEAHLALLRAGEGRDFTPEFPGLAAFNHAIVHLPGKTPLWIDPTVPQARVGQIPSADAGRHALIIAPGTKGTTALPMFQARDNCEVQTREVFLAEDGPGRVIETTESKGPAEVAQRVQFTGADPAKLKENLREHIKATYRSETLGETGHPDPLALDQPFRLRVEAKKAGNAYTSSKDARVVLNPWPLVTALSQYLKPGEPDPRDPRPTEETKGGIRPRRTRLELPRPWSGEMNWILHAPDGYGIEVLPESHMRAFGPATLHMAWRRAENGTVEANFRFECDRLKWTPAEVDQARAALKAFGEEPSPVIVFQNLGEAHLEAGRLKEAMAEFRGLSQRHPTAPGPLVRLAQAEQTAGLAEASRKTLGRAISLDPSAEQPHRQLGWSLQHDAMGRRFHPGWDRAGAAAELRKSMELAPDLRMARLDLAILLGHDERGDWWVSRDMDAALHLYRDQLAKGKDERAQEHLTIGLARGGAYAEARASAQLLENKSDRNAWTIALDACLKGAEAAIQEAKRSHQEPEARHKALQGASDLLMVLRRYPEAGAVSSACAVGAEAAKYQARATLAPRLKRHEEVATDPKTPVGAVLALARATAHRGFDAGEALALLSPPQRPAARDEATLLKTMDGLHYFRTNSRDWRLQKLDELHSTVEFGIEGSERTGYRIRVPRPNPIPGVLFVSSQDGICRVVAWGTQPARLGKEARWEAERGNLEGARAWLDRAMDQVIQPTVQDPLSGHPVGHVWVKGRAGDLAEIRLAAALLVLGEAEDAAARKVVAEALPTATDPGLRGALLRTLLYHRHPDRKAADQYSAELLSRFPDKPRGPGMRASVLKEDRRFEEALVVLRTARKVMPDQESLLLNEANTLARMGRLTEAGDLLQQAVREGKESAAILNNLAWNDLCVGRVTERTVAWAERAVQLVKDEGHSNTLACVQASLGRYAQSREALLEAVPDEGPIDRGTWFALGLIAVALDDQESARVYFSRVDTPENEEDPADPLTCKAMARKYLTTLGKGRG
ncbi:MAG: DUF3857 domain-containing protein [Holophagaceae bacterium]